MFYRSSLEGRRMVLGDVHKDTLSSLNNMGAILYRMKDYEGALDYYQQALRAQEKVLGKTHPNTLLTIMNTANTYTAGLKDFVKAERMFRRALDGYERSLGKEYEGTKTCAFMLALMLHEQGRQDDLQKLLTAYPSIEEDEDWDSDEGDDDED